MAMRSFALGLVQLAPRLGDVAANLALHESAVREARGRGADLVVFPELSLTGYFLRDMVPTVALGRDAPELRRLAELSREVALVAGLVEEAPDHRFYNAAFYFEGGELKHVHRKVYLPTYGLFDEMRYMARGDRIRAFDSRFGRLALLVCEDCWHPSAVLLAALDGALSIVCLAASPLRGVCEGAEIDENARYWESVNRVHAETFACFFAFANRVGFEDGVGFWGGSEVLAPDGARLAKARYYEPDLICAEVHREAVRRRRIANPLLRDEDIDLTINELCRLRGRAVPPQRDAEGRRGSGMLRRSARAAAEGRRAKQQGRKVRTRARAKPAPARVRGKRAGTRAKRRPRTSRTRKGR